MSEQTVNDLNWLVQMGYHVYLKPINLDPPIVMTRVEKNNKLVVQTSQESINLGVDEVTRRIKHMRGKGV